jgi:hypothetical protein
MTAFSSYSLLQDAVISWVDRHDTNISTRCQQSIAMVEDRVNRELRMRQMETRATITAAAYVDYPDDYLEMRDLQLNLAEGTRTLQMMSPSQIDKLYSQKSGVPVAYCEIANQIQLGPAPDGSYTLEMDYYASVPALSGTNPSNWLLEIAGDVYLWGACFYLLSWTGDARSAQARQLWDDAMDGLQRADNRARWSGPPTAVVPG